MKFIFDRGKEKSIKVDWEWKVAERKSREKFTVICKKTIKERQWQQELIRSRRKKMKYVSLSANLINALKPLKTFEQITDKIITLECKRLALHIDKQVGSHRAWVESVNKQGGLRVLSFWRHVMIGVLSSGNFVISICTLLKRAALRETFLLLTVNETLEILNCVCSKY